jgi:hypothetical protein
MYVKLSILDMKQRSANRSDFVYDSHLFSTNNELDDPVVVASRRIYPN